jgi:hypothetical protein
MYENEAKCKSFPTYLLPLLPLRGVENGFYLPKERQ